MRTLATLMIFFTIACSSKGNDAELAKAASAAMAELNTADETVPDQIAKAISEITGSLIMGTSGTADVVKTKILPIMDSYVATIERAVKTADAYMADKDDEKTKQALEKIRKRGEAFRKARERFIELEKKARAGATADEISASLMNIGMGLSVGQ